MFQPWNRMGNIKGWGGPITLSYLWKDLQLNKKVSVGGLFDRRLWSERWRWACFPCSPRSPATFPMSSSSARSLEVTCRRCIRTCPTRFLLPGPTSWSPTDTWCCWSPWTPCSRRLAPCSSRSNYILPLQRDVSLHPSDFYGYTSHFYNGDLFMEMDVTMYIPSHL